MEHPGYQQSSKNHSVISTPLRESTTSERSQLINSTDNTIDLKKTLTDGVTESISKY